MITVASNGDQKNSNKVKHAYSSLSSFYFFFYIIYDQFLSFFSVPFFQQNLSEQNNK